MSTWCGSIQKVRIILLAVLNAPLWVCIYAEINAKYVETSAKTGFNIGESSSGLSL